MMMKDTDKMVNKHYAQLRKGIRVADDMAIKRCAELREACARTDDMINADRIKSLLFKIINPLFETVNFYKILENK